MTIANPITCIERCLLVADVADDAGDTFTMASLEAAVADFKTADTLIAKTSHSNAFDAVGIVSELKIKGKALLATVSFLDTAEGRKAAKLVADGELNYSVGGHTEDADTVKTPEGRTIKRFRLREVATVPDKVGYSKSLSIYPLAAYQIHIDWSDEDQVYIASIEDWRGCKTHGKTVAEAQAMGREVLEMLIESAMITGDPMLPRAKR